MSDLIRNPNDGLCRDMAQLDYCPAENTVLILKAETLKLCTHDQDLRIRKFCIREQKYFLLCVHMAFKDQQNLSKIESLFYKSNSYFLELRTCLNILIWFLQASKLLPGESTYVTMHML